MVYRPKFELCWQTLSAVLLPSIAALNILNAISRLRSSTGSFANIVFDVAFWSFIALTSCKLLILITYELTATELIIRGGLCAKPRRRIPLVAIFAVEPSRGEWFHPVCSNDALKIRFHTNRVVGDFIIIAPRDKAGFLAELARSAPELRPLPRQLADLISPEGMAGVDQQKPPAVGTHASLSPTSDC